VCKNSVTNESLGYAYVNFENEADADRAIDVFNFELMNGKPMRVMRSQRDPSLRKSGAGNIFIKNLDQSIDSKTLYDTFSAFGSILSCKIATNEDGSSKGYGFIQFEKEEDAKIAIKKANGMLICGLLVYVGKFKTKKEREKELYGNDAFTKVFIKNFDESFNEDALHELFSKFGSIKSSKIMRNENGTSKGFGFVDFENESSANAAVVRTKQPRKRAQKKDEGQNGLQSENSKFNRGVNLYVKNLDDSVNDDILRKMFSPFGTITSAKVMRDDDDRSKGFGFICFSSQEEASLALIGMNNRFVGRKPLYVAVAQPKEYRKIYTSQLKQHMNSLSHMHQQNGSNNMPTGVQPPRYFQPPISTVQAHRFHSGTQDSNKTQSENVAHVPPLNNPSNQR
ncbi:Polyadenylate-binding protein, partial [Armadillidium nasatum]